MRFCLKAILRRKNLESKENKSFDLNSRKQQRKNKEKLDFSTTIIKVRKTHSLFTITKMEAKRFQNFNCDFKIFNSLFPLF